MVVQFNSTARGTYTFALMRMTRFSFVGMTCEDRNIENYNVQTLAIQNVAGEVVLELVVTGYRDLTPMDTGYSSDRCCWSLTIWDIP